MGAPQWGVGLRPHHYGIWQSHTKQLPVLEIMADNYMGQKGGPGLKHVDDLRARTPVVMHGIGLNIACATGIDKSYVQELKLLVNRWQPLSVSDHLCFSRSATHNSFDLLPFPYSEAMLKIVTENVLTVQDILGQALTLENISSYVRFKKSEMTEIEFLRELTSRTQCGLLLDVNNLFVCAHNHAFAAESELAKVPFNAVSYLHVSGHSVSDALLVDTHDSKVLPSVWNLLRLALQKTTNSIVILERDDDDVTVEELMAELSAGENFLKEIAP